MSTDMKIATRSAWLEHWHSCEQCSIEGLCETGKDRLQAMADWMSDGESLPAWFAEAIALP